MDKELNNNLPEDNSWLDDILGTGNIAKELGADELAMQAAGLTHPEDLELESILAEDWGDPEPLEMPLPLSMEEDLAAETLFDEVSDMEQLDIPTDQKAPEEGQENLLPEETEASDLLPSAEEISEPETGDDLVVAAVVGEVSEEMTAIPETEEIPEAETITEDMETDESAAESITEDSMLPEDMDADAILEEILAESKQEQETAVSEDATMYFTPVTPEQTEPTPEEAPKEEKPPVQKPKERKVRPKFKKGYGLLGIPHVAATVIWLMIIVVIGLTIGNTLWVCITDLMAFGKPDRSITITITPEDVKTDEAGKKTVNIDAIAKKLKDAGLIKYPEVFKFFAADLTDKYLDIDAGTFTLNSKFDYNAMINNMILTAAPREEIDIMIPEGYTCAQIFSLLEEKGVCTIADLEEAAANGELGDYWFLEGVTRGDRYCLEGYLFPDTYRFYLNDEPGNVLKKFLDGFDYRFTNVMREKLDTMKERTGMDIGIREVVIIASMIEKETANGAESYDISSVIFNRLNNAANYPFLNIDATIVYYLGGNIDPETGLSKPLTETQIYTDHPYNTYTRRGLPPGAISNPGRNSLDAALDPNQGTGFYYYVFNPQTGEHIFAKTLYEHEQNIRYVNSLG